MIGGIVADIFEALQRNTPMALFSWAALFGTGLGPVIGGFISEYSTWRWIFYVQIIVGGLIVLMVMAFFRETRESVILRKKARILNQWHEELHAQGYSENGIAYVRWKLVGAAEEHVDIIKLI
jgi:MFS family permease